MASVPAQELPVIWFRQISIQHVSRYITIDCSTGVSLMTMHVLENLSFCQLFSSRQKMMWLSHHLRAASQLQTRKSWPLSRKPNLQRRRELRAVLRTPRTYSRLVSCMLSLFLPGLLIMKSWFQFRCTSWDGILYLLNDPRQNVFLSFSRMMPSPNRKVSQKRHRSRNQPLPSLSRISPRSPRSPRESRLRWISPRNPSPRSPRVRRHMGKPRKSMWRSFFCCV